MWWIANSSTQSDGPRRSELGPQERPGRRSKRGAAERRRPRSISATRARSAQPAEVDHVEGDPWGRSDRLDRTAVRPRGRSCAAPRGGRRSRRGCAAGRRDRWPRRWRPRSRCRSGFPARAGAGTRAVAARRRARVVCAAGGDGRLVAPVRAAAGRCGARAIRAAGVGGARRPRPPSRTAASSAGGRVLEHGLQRHGRPRTRSRTSDTSRVASREWPPTSKKLSVIDTRRRSRSHARSRRRRARRPSRGRTCSIARPAVTDQRPRAVRIDLPVRAAGQPTAATNWSGTAGPGRWRRAWAARRPASAGAVRRSATSRSTPAAAATATTAASRTPACSSSTCVDPVQLDRGARAA